MQNEPAQSQGAAGVSSAWLLALATAPRLHPSHGADGRIPGASAELCRQTPAFCLQIGREKQNNFKAVIFC